MKENSCPVPLKFKSVKNEFPNYVSEPTSTVLIITLDPNFPTNHPCSSFQTSTISILSTRPFCLETHHYPNTLPTNLQLTIDNYTIP